MGLHGRCAGEPLRRDPPRESSGKVVHAMNAKGDANRSVRMTKQRLYQALIRLLQEKDLREITVRELTEQAGISRGTFYFHYADIYALSEAIERETVLSIIDSIKDLKDEFFDNTAGVTRALCLAFLSQVSLIRILFSGKEQNHLANQLDRELKKVIFRKNPEYEKDIEKNIILSYCIQGAYHAYQNNPEADTETFVRTIEEIVKCLQPIL